jgi:5-methylcytosine-specific restriction endonuclease McrA
LRSPLCSSSPAPRCGTNVPPGETAYDCVADSTDSRKIRCSKPPRRVRFSAASARSCAQDTPTAAKVELDLHRHLFGSDRLIPLKSLREGIAALQAGRCFYCRGPLGVRPEADHFIPRVRCGVDAVENLVLADRACNNDKRDLLPGPPLVAAWARRNEHHAGRLAQLAKASRWDTDPDATVAVARSIYSHLAEGGTPLWLGIRNVGREDPAAVLAVLAEPSLPDGRLTGASGPKTLARIWHRGPPGAVYSRCQPDTRARRRRARMSWTVTAAATYVQVRAGMSTSGAGSATMHESPAGVAQLAEQPSCKRQVSGSNPLTGSQASITRANTRSSGYGACAAKSAANC